jgi:hypothetical protein
MSLLPPQPSEEPTMTPSSFVRALEAELRLRGVAFELRELLNYAADVWSMAQHNPDPALWASAFVKDRAIVERMRAAGGPVYVHMREREEG